MIVSDSTLSLLRSGGQVAATGITLLGTIAVLPPETVSAAIADVKLVVDGLSQATKGITNLLIVLGPVLGAFIAYIGHKKASLPAQVEAVKEAAPAALAQAVAQVSPSQMVAAVNALPNVSGVVTTATPEGRALAAAIPDAGVAPAGTAAAASIAKT